MFSALFVSNISKMIDYFKLEKNELNKQQLYMLEDIRWKNKKDVTTAFVF